MSAYRSTEEIVPIRGLQIYPSHFRCPHCPRTADRGGKAEGFRKAGMSNHVAACREVRLLEAGFVERVTVSGKREAMPVDEFDEWSRLPENRYWAAARLRNIRASRRRFMKAGDL